MSIIKGEFHLSKRENGGVNIQYEDYGTGGDFDREVIYGLDEANTQKLLSLLPGAAADGLEARLTAAFGRCLDNGSFAAWCDEHGIHYSLFTWIS